MSHMIPRSRFPDRQCLTWSRVASGSPAPPPRSGAASVVVQGKLYIFGGYGGGTGRLDDFYAYDFQTKSWEEVEVRSAVRPGCRENNGVVISDTHTCKSIYLFGGYNGQAWLNDLWCFDIESKHWTCIQGSSDPVALVPVEMDEANAAAEGAAAAAADQNALVNNTVRGRAPSRRFGYVSVVHEGKFVLFGGFDGTRWLADMYVFDFRTKTWTEIEAKGALPSPRSCPAWAKDDTHCYIQGGYDGVERKADFFACDLSTYTWTEMPCLGSPPSPRYFHSCCLPGGHKLYLYGGYSGSERLSDMYAYDFETNHWSPVDCTNGDAPSGRSSLVAQVYENSLYVFGGYNGTTVLNDFYRFRLKPVSIPPSALVHDFSKLINNSDLADVRFLVEGQIVCAHKAILAIRSEYFRVMLCGGMKESGTVAMITDCADDDRKQADDGTEYSNINSIELPDVSYAVFLKVLEFLYTDSVREVSLESGIHLMIASEQFMLDRLKNLCEDSIRRDIKVENVIQILAASHRHNAMGLKDIALEFILRHLKDPVNPVVMAGLSDLRSEPDLLLEIIKRSSGTAGVGGDGGNLPAGAPNAPSFGGAVGPFVAGAAEWDARR